jgi:hypothetical protein
MFFLKRIVVGLIFSITATCTLKLKLVGCDKQKNEQRTTERQEHRPVWVMVVVVTVVILLWVRVGI